MSARAACEGSVVEDDVVDDAAVDSGTIGGETAAEGGSVPADRRWPGLDVVPAGAVARARGAAASALFRRAARRVGVRVEYPGGVTGGSAGAEVPRIVVRRPGPFARRIGATGLIGFGEAYMAGDWTTDDLVGVLTPFARETAALVPRPLQVLRRLVLPGPPADEENTTANTRANVARHYDLSNDLFAAFLDETMSYSSALFECEPSGETRFSWSDLPAAQRRKIDRLLDVAGVGPGTRLLEIGTGWGELCLRAAQRGAVVRSVTLSAEQCDLARRRVAEAGFGDRVTVDLCDYREVAGEYDAVVSVEMIEAVGRKYWPEYFRSIDRLLGPGGRAAIQAITMPHGRLLASENTYTWVQKYVFPGGQLTSLEGIGDVVGERTSLRVTGTSSFGPHYAETLRLWRERFRSREDDVLALGFDRTFLRMWELYLAYSEAGFRSGYLDVVQLGFSR
ncbi:cyclopropane-fatty-acyl-phospholipid synthase family protein [Gordonia sp. (in: high G+C Gram-positive bacteria)]|uniref:SAM-dependent methyltransferase n=1 Tax=Gordonia sp. (in: high G+C Gram-positive bacteria) TaxID=84139 RepID=UPI00262B7DAE|nr:cyclopropane-fatty-acyl-phospholipid synthase family protein [Gordonia sp. (in: high G+C Gram-positive bacteria)]